MRLRRTHTEERGNPLAALVRGSIILKLLDRFSAYVYRLLKTGFFGFLFTGYRDHLRSVLWPSLVASRVGAFFGRCRRRLSEAMEQSVFAAVARWGTRALLGCRLKFYGAFFTTFGAYAAVLTIISSLISSGGSLDADIFLSGNILSACVLILASLPLSFSKKSLAEALCSSRTGALLRLTTGFSEEDLRAVVGGHMSTAFLLGMICGVLSYRIPPVFLVGAMACLLAAYLILIRPELGVLALFFFMPFLPTMALAVLVLYTFFCYVLKLIRQKRVFRLEPIDVTVAAFAFMQLTGGVVSVSRASLRPALLFVCFLAAYFLVVGLIRSGEWLARCSVACVLSAALVSAWGLVQYFTGGSSMAEAWLDAEMFDGITARAVSTLENPNMLGEYLVLLIPVGVGLLLRRDGGLRKLTAFFCLMLMGACLIATWSRGAWLALMLALTLFLFMWHRRAVYVLVAGLAVIPALPFLLPQSIIARFTSIGNLGDSSTSYRVYIWRAAVHMIKDNLLSGIGTGEGAWYQIYPSYTYLGVEAAPHSHNLFLQITLELGVVGIGLFVVFLFLLYQSGFTYFARLSSDSVAVPEHLLIPHGDPDTGAGPGVDVDANRNIRRSKLDLRISAAAPLCGVFGVLVQGMTDYSWYNYRVYLMFWLVCGLASAHIRSGTALMEDSGHIQEGSGTEYAVDYVAAPSGRRRNGGRGGKGRTMKKTDHTMWTIGKRSSKAERKGYSYDQSKNTV